VLFFVITVAFAPGDYGHIWEKNFEGLLKKAGIPSMSEAGHLLKRV
jgi:hypothetical protein